MARRSANIWPRKSVAKEKRNPAFPWRARRRSRIGLFSSAPCSPTKLSATVYVFMRVGVCLKPFPQSFRRFASRRKHARSTKRNRAGCAGTAGPVVGTGGAGGGSGRAPGRISRTGGVLQIAQRTARGSLQGPHRADGLRGGLLPPRIPHSAERPHRLRSPL